MKLYPLKFTPQLVARIWGGQRLYAIKNAPVASETVGESWEISSVKGQESQVEYGDYKGVVLSELYKEKGLELVGARIYNSYPTEFPLLIKLIDACDDLSLQVHPNDALAQELHQSSFGKTEMWYVMEVQEDSRIIAGLSKKTNWDELMHAIQNKQVEDLLKVYKPQAGDTFFLPAGCIHAIGKGALIAEIQQSSDLTYRLYDYDRTDSLGNKRDLHLNEAEQAIDFNNLTPCKITRSEGVESSRPLVTVPHFSCHEVKVSKNYLCPITEKDSFLIYICTSGSGYVVGESGDSYSINYGETIFLPASLTSATIVSDSSMTLLEVFM